MVLCDLLKQQGLAPHALITDRLKSWATATDVSNLPFSDLRHRFIACQCSSSRPEAAKARRRAGLGQETETATGVTGWRHPGQAGTSGG
jgi:hypothetical protein